MIEPEDFFNAMKSQELDYYTGVPDSLLKSLCAYMTTYAPPENHVIAANEGGAVALAIGYHLSTGKVPVVYMQNSGLGNIINPILSLADNQVYGIPMILVIGWRGEILGDGSQLHDEPQHKKQGRVTEALLVAMGLSYRIIDQHSTNYAEIIREAAAETTTTAQPVALLIRKGTFNKYALPRQNITDHSLISREQAIEIIVGQMPENAFIIATTGMASRELYELREASGVGHEKDFLVVGGMGHASQIACEISKNSDKNIYCLDGDGACLMHMGSMALNRDGKFCHIVLNNGVHDSVGGQPTAASNIDLAAIATACGYQRSISVRCAAELREAFKSMADFHREGSCLIDVQVAAGARTDLGRPSLTSQQMKQANMHYLRDIGHGTG